MKYLSKIIFISFLASVTFLSIAFAENNSTKLGEPKMLQKEKPTIKDHHASLNFKCATCHGDGPEEKYTKLEQKDCFQCHGNYEKLAERTGHLGYDDNVHASPHYPNMDCDLCHATHKPTKNYCVMCHSQQSMKKLLVP